MFLAIILRTISESRMKTGLEREMLYNSWLIFCSISKDGTRDLRLWGRVGKFSHDLGRASEDVELILRMHVNARTVTL